MNKFLKNVGTRGALVGAGLAAFAGSAAAEVDTAAVTAELATVATAVGAIGAAILLIYVGIKAYKMIRASM